MTDEPAAIQASFADFRLIKGRKQAQIILEIPIEGADAALAALGGIPQPQSDRWVAVARLNGDASLKKGLPPDETHEINQTPQLNKGVTYGEFAQVVENAYYKTHPEAVKKDKPEPKGKRKWDDLKLSMQAGIRCSEPAFWKFLTERFRLKLPIENEELAAENVRDFCQIDSRCGLNGDAESANLWRHLDREYQAWLKVCESWCER